jgi:hypothetical protein
VRDLAGDPSVTRLPRRRGEKPQEPAVAVNPLDPRNVIVSFHQAVGEGSDHHPDVRVEAHVAATKDGGETWTVTNVTHPGHRMSIDTIVAFDGRGHAYLVFLGMDDMALQSKHGQYVLRSTDGGATWGPRGSLIERPGDVALLEHMPKIAVDPDGDDVYVVWDRILHDRREEMVVVRSSDGGESWSEPRVISEHGSTTLPGVAVGPDGTLYVLATEAANLWEGGSWEVKLLVSRDRGMTFDAPETVAHTKHAMLSLKSFPRACWLPTVGVDPQGRVLVAWADSSTRSTAPPRCCTPIAATIPRTRSRR